MLSTILAIPRRLYDWTLHWADTQQALIAQFLLALAESSFFPVPPDVLLIAIVAARPAVWLRAATICSAGSLVGAAIGYGIGSGLMATVGEPIIELYGASQSWDRFVALADTWGVWVLAAAAFTPIPFKVATIAAGAIELPFASFLAISLIGRARAIFSGGRRPPAVWRDHSAHTGTAFRSRHTHLLRPAHGRVRHPSLPVTGVSDMVDCRTQPRYAGLPSTTGRTRISGTSYG